MRKKIIAANWKMNMTAAEAASFMEDLKLELKKFDGAEIVIIPPFTSLPRLSEIITQLPGITLGAQNMWHETSGAFTGSSAKLGTPSTMPPAAAAPAIFRNSLRPTAGPGKDA